MRIVLVGPVYPYRGGIAHFTFTLAQQLEASRHDVHIISYHRQYPAKLYPGRTDKDPSKHSNPKNVVYIIDGINPLSWVKTVRHIRILQPDIVLLQWWTTYWAFFNAVVSYYLQRYNIPIIYIIHNAMPHESTMFDRWLTKIALSQANKFITLSKRELNRLQGLITNKTIKTAPLPFFHLLAKERYEKHAALQELGLPPDTPIILFFGIVRKYKGVVVLIKAIANLISRGKKVYLVIAGEFWKDKDIYLNLIKNNHLTNIVTIDDRYIPDEQVALYFSAANVYVAPYTAGSQSAAIRIAIAYGLPIVLSDVIYDEELFEPLDAYPLFVIPSGDYLALAQAIEKAIVLPPSNPKINDGWANLIKTIEGLVK